MKVFSRLMVGAALAAVSTLALAQAPAAQPPAAQPPQAGSTAGSSSAGADTGLAAVYSARLNGHRTASGQIYNPNKLTAAHKTLAFGTRVKVTNTKNGKSVVVRINDRGPTQPGRVLDLSPRAARALGIRRHGMAEVSIEVQN